MNGVKKFSISVDPLRCARDQLETYHSACNMTSRVSKFFPGGVEGVRLHRKTLNATLLDSGVFKDYNSIVVHNAPGSHLDYLPIRNEFIFDRIKDCDLYGHTTEGVYLCFASDGDYLNAGTFDLLWAHPC